MLGLITINLPVPKNGKFVNMILLPCPGAGCSLGEYICKCVSLHLRAARTCFSNSCIKVECSRCLPNRTARLPNDEDDHIITFIVFHSLHCIVCQIYVPTRCKMTDLYARTICVKLSIQSPTSIITPPGTTVRLHTAWICLGRQVCALRTPHLSSGSAYTST